MIPFNKPYFTGKETYYIEQAVKSGKISGNGMFTQKCHQFLEQRYGFKKCLLTTSCTDALEMAAILCDIQPGDEVIVPSYTFVSTALAFVRQGAKIVFADSYSHHPNIDADNIEELITSKTKVIVPVHYAGVPCDMEKIMELATKFNLLVVEDAAQAVDSYYTPPQSSEGCLKKSALGSIGHFGCFSFHETKNIISGEGGMLAINDERFMQRAEIIWEKGTNRAEFFRGEVNKYGWVDTGSSFLPSEVIAAFLWAQLENIDFIQKRRLELWRLYYAELKGLAAVGNLKLPVLPSPESNNAHMFYVLCNSFEERCELIDYMKMNSVMPVFHYLCLHTSEYYTKQFEIKNLPMAKVYEDCLLRLPLFFELENTDVVFIVKKIADFYANKLPVLD
jgi:dTDP-4-amino-4,6-dideoxygalactose transaminase